MKAGAFLTWAVGIWIAGFALRCWMHAVREFLVLLWVIINDKDEIYEREQAKP